MMRIATIVLIASSIFISSCGENKVRTTITSANGASTPNTAPSVPKDGVYQGRGIVTKVNRSLGAVEIDHEEIDAVMPPMKMEFFVKDKSILNGIKAGDKVVFDLEYKHPTEMISGIRLLK
jgi:Cu/Ag efflux protein CusF